MGLTFQILKELKAEVIVRFIKGLNFASVMLHLMQVNVELLFRVYHD